MILSNYIARNIHEYTAWSFCGMNACGQNVRPGNRRFWLKQVLGVE